MPHVAFDFPIAVPSSRVFEAVSTPAGLDAWWTLRAKGTPEEGAIYELHFGEAYDWRGRVTGCAPGTAFELEITRATPDWSGTRVRFELAPQGASTRVQFRHEGWRNETKHFRTTAYCWALYLRVMRRWLEHGESVPYERRLDA